MDHIGIDVHKQESQICILEEGDGLIERRIKTTRRQFGAVFGERQQALILVEASTESEWVARCLEELGHEVIVADPNFAAMYATRSRRVKTDKRDARTLAEACKLGAYRPAHRVSDERRHLRAQLSVREALVRTRSKYISLIRSLLRRQGWRVGSGSAACFTQRLAKVEISQEARKEIAPLVTMLEELQKQIVQMDKLLDEDAQRDEDAKRLSSMPSIGPVTALAFASAVDKASRFSGPHQVESYLGLVPSEYSSGEKQRRGRITKAGNSRVRRLLVQAAVSTMRLRKLSTSRLWTWAERIAARRGRRIAIVALARCIAGILYAMMRDKASYQPAKGATAAA